MNDQPGFIQNGALSFPAGGVDPNTHADIGEALTMVGTSTENIISTASQKAPFQLCKVAAGAAGCAG